MCIIGAVGLMKPGGVCESLSLHLYVHLFSHSSSTQLSFFALYTRVSSFIT